MANLEIDLLAAVPRKRGRRSEVQALKDVEDGHLCQLACGCHVRRMAEHPTKWSYVVAWLEADCGMKSNQCATFAALRLGHYTDLRGGVRSLMLSGDTPASFDPLADELAQTFRK